MSSRSGKLTSKDLKQPDEFVTATGRVVQWAQDNRSTVQGIAGLFVLGLLTIVLGSLWSNSRNARANQEFYSAIELYGAEQWAEAYEGFDALADSLGGTDYGRLATLYAGRSALKIGRFPEAIEQLEAYLDTDPPAGLEQLARLDLGRAQGENGDAAAANATLREALDQNGPARPEVLIELARVEAAAGRSDEAIALYTRYLEDEPDGPAVDLARSRIRALGGTPPVEAFTPPGFGPGGINPLQIRTQ